MESTILEIVNYEPAHQPWFEKLNRDWIEKYFWMELIDEQVLQHPESHILNHGGTVLMALFQNQVAGTVALKYVEAGVFEFTKMAVAEQYQGKKIGETLALVAIQTAKEKGAKKIILYSNTKLHKAIALYRKLGFVEVALDGPYQRSDIKMELNMDREPRKTFSMNRGVLGLL